MRGAVVDVTCHCGAPVAPGRLRYCSKRCAEVALSERQSDYRSARNRARIAREQRPCRVCRAPIAPGHRVRETCGSRCYQRLRAYRQWAASVAA